MLWIFSSGVFFYVITSLDPEAFDFIQLISLFLYQGTARHKEDLLYSFHVF